MAEPTNTQHTFIDARCLANDTWAYLYRRGDGYKLNYCTKTFDDEYVDLNQKSYRIVSRKKLVAADKGCYHLWVKDADSGIEMELLNDIPTLGPVPLCLGSGDCSGQANACSVGLVPECSNSVLNCVDPED